MKRNAITLFYVQENYIALFLRRHIFLLDRLIYDFDCNVRNRGNRYCAIFYHYCVIFILTNSKINSI